MNELVTWLVTPRYDVSIAVLVAIAIGLNLVWKGLTR